MDTARLRTFDNRLEPIEGRDVAAAPGPHPLAVIGSRCGDALGFATVAWTMPLSYNPPLMAFALRAKSHTFSLIKASGRFSASTPDAALVDAVNACGNNTGRTMDKSALVDWMLLPENEGANQDASLSKPACQTDPLPALAGALTVFDCDVESIQETGDHMLVIGRIKRAWSRASKDERGRIDATDALLCVQHDLFATAK